MTTFKDVADQVHTFLHSGTGIQEQLTWLTADVADSDVVLPINDGTQFSLGITEVDQELIYVSTVGTNNLGLPPFGRGFRGTTATPHSANAMVTFSPAWPQFLIRQAINQVLVSIYPTLYAVKSTSFSSDTVTAAYAMPSDADGVMTVTYDANLPSKYWPRLDDFEFDSNANNVAFASGKSITFGRVPMSGSLINVTYRAPFVPFVADSDTLTDVGLPESCADLLVLGAGAKLIRLTEPARIQVMSVQNQARAAVVQVGDAEKIGNDWFALFNQRLQQERMKQLELQPAQMRFSR